MINLRDLTSEQLIALVTMQHFNCDHINCNDCPLFSKEHGCGSQRAGNIIHRYEEETKQ